MKSGLLARASAWLGCAAFVLALAGPACAADLGNSPTASDTQVAAARDNPFTDVPENSWAYQAIVQLHNDGLLEGYPNGYFHGKRPLTRYEIAVMTQRVVDKLESDFSDADKATKVNSDDIALVRKLLDAYGSDLADVKKNLAATKAESDASAFQLKRANLHVTMFARPGLFGERSSVVNAAGVRVAGAPSLYGTTFATQASGLLIANANYRQDGSSTHGTGYQFVRVGIDGDLSDRLSYETEFEDVLTYDSIQSTSNSGGNAGRLDTASMKYTTPTGWTFTGGRFLAKDSPVGLLYEDYFNGVRVGYGHDKYDATLGYSFNAAGSSNSSALSNIVSPSQTLFAHVKYQFSKKISGGASYTSDTFPTAGIAGATAFEISPTTGLATEAVGNKLQLQGEIARHLGKNPNTGAKYVQPTAFWGKAYYGNTVPTINHNYAEAGYIVAGVNGLSAHNGTFGLGDDYQQFYVGSLDGYHLVYLGAHHYLADNASVGLVYQRYALNSGVVLPQAAGNVTAIPTFLQHDQGQALFLETKLAF
jgi:hypothetical protein